MARVTVEDCVVQIPNRFELVMLAAHRARALASGAELAVERDRDKNPVVALREIAETRLDLSTVEESLVKTFQKRIEPEQPEEELLDAMTGEQQNWADAMDDVNEPGSQRLDDLADDEGDEEGLETDSASGENMSETFEDADVKD